MAKSEPVAWHRSTMLAPEAPPASAIGVVAEGYRRRRDAGHPPFTAFTCDNIQHNGDVFRRAVLDFARLHDPALAGWIEAEAAFPNSMVDRITPVTTPEDIAAAASFFARQEASFISGQVLYVAGGPKA